jgi:hypothetical protein
MSQGAQTPTTADACLRVVQIISGALVFGVVMFLAIVVLVVRGGRLFAAEPWDATSVVTLMAILMAATAAPLAFVLPGVITRKALQDGPPVSDGAREEPGYEGWGPHARQLFALFTTEQIIRLALLEGPAFLAAIAFMMEGKIPALILAGVLVLLMVSLFPTANRVRAWMDNIRAAAPGI